MAARSLFAGACVLLLWLSPACTAGDPSPPGPPPTDATPTSATGPAAAPPVQLTVSGIDSNGTTPPSDDVVAQVKAALERYVTEAVVTPLHSGGPAPDLSGIFTAGALERVSGPDRPTMVEEGLPPASRTISVDVALVTLSTLSGPDGATSLVAARLDLRVHAVGPGLDVDIARQGDLVLVPEDGGWRIEAFHVITTRDSRS